MNLRDQGRVAVRSLTTVLALAGVVTTSALALASYVDIQATKAATARTPVSAPSTTSPGSDDTSTSTAPAATGVGAGTAPTSGSAAATQPSSPTGVTAGSGPSQTISSGS